MPFKYYCHLGNGILLASTMASTLFIIFMTFERFYSILRPHKAASFNTIKRAKITIVCAVLFSYAYNFPHFILTKQVGNQWIPYGSAMKYTLGQFYYWFSTVLSFFLPCVLLLIMNSFIIHTLRKRSRSNLTRSDTQSQGQSQNGQGHSSRIKNSEYQIFTSLLFITFAFLILNTPPYALWSVVCHGMPCFMIMNNQPEPLLDIMLSTILHDKLIIQIMVSIFIFMSFLGRNSRQI